MNQFKLLLNQVHLFIRQAYPVLLATLMIVSCHEDKQPVPVEEKAAIEKAIRGSIGWAKEKDFPLLYSIIAPDSSYLEIDPEDRIVKGIDEFRKAEKFWASPDFRAIRYEISDLRIDLSGCGDVAWFFCRLNDINEWKGQPASWLNTRWTGVLVKRAGKWILVQSHFSFPAK
jgi:ketosteroid isomerase-like protein